MAPLKKRSNARIVDRVRQSQQTLGKSQTALTQGQQPRDNRPQKPEDLIAYVRSADGKPVSGVEVKVVFFAGFGAPDISTLTKSSLTTSDADGKTRFSNDQNWRNWIKAEVAAKNKSKSRGESHDVTEFKAFSWCLSGYWPRATCVRTSYRTADGHCPIANVPNQNTGVRG